ncbi:TIMELESS-interacting protein [Sitophilus oryzae]|uniref:TIMELESS-interacting protein n=1 Tax=Sitophilus oryzae TaxID=7048 RepID=A0A6J2X4T6_SITOR|nr:TIMELESS-interacting protein [Sitophilus oryzae]
MSSDEELTAQEVISDTENEVVQIGDQDNEQQTEEVNRDGADEENTQRIVVKPKRVVRNPQPKLNEETLKGLRGIAAIQSYFDRVKFKGKGYEDQDLNVIMKTYEYWCHRLFPKFPFDTCIERLEKLGTKRATQTHIKRIRYDLLIEEDKPILDDSDEEHNVDGFIDVRPEQINQQTNDSFDKLLVSSNRPQMELSEDQLERMRLNKEKAAELRRQRLQLIQDKASENLVGSNQLPSTSYEQAEMSDLNGNSASNNDENSDGFYASQNSESSYSKEMAHIEDFMEFNHESTVKGKSNVTGNKVKKTSLKKGNKINSHAENNNSLTEDYSISTDGHHEEVSRDELSLERANELHISNEDNTRLNNEFSNAVQIATSMELCIDESSRENETFVDVQVDSRVLKESFSNNIQNSEELSATGTRRSKKRVNVLDSDED